MATIEAINKSRLPADMKDRDRFVGYASFEAERRDNTFRRGSRSQTPLADFKPNRVSIRGTPQNGYIITAGDDFKPTIMEKASVVYLNVSVERVNMPRDERPVIWVRAEIEKSMLRIPPLPAVRITGKGVRRGQCIPP
jgi:hypothetical protein